MASRFDGGGSDERAPPYTETGSGLPVGLLAILAVGVVVVWGVMN